MPKKEILARLARARVSEKLALKLTVYAQRHKCSESDVIRDALKKFLRNVSTKNYNNKATAYKKPVMA